MSDACRARGVGDGLETPPKKTPQILLRPGGALEEDRGVDDGVVPAGRAQDGDRVQAADGPKDAGHHLQGPAEEGEIGEGLLRDRGVPGTWYICTACKKQDTT